jgi:type I restriction enzyme S subunit
MNKKEKMTFVPRLRFPEFISTEGWQAYTLNKIADRLTEKVGDKQLTTLSISAGVGFVSQEEKFSRDISGKQYHN